MSNQNITMRKYNGTTWDELYPKTVAAQVVEDSTKRFASDSEKSTWNGKQDALGFSPENTANKGTANGYASLDSGGKVPSSQLPSYVDDVVEHASQSGFPGTGETGKIYIAQDTNKTYRWSGSAYIEISASLALGETSSTAYAGDKGKIAYDHSQTSHAPSNAQKNSDITKSEIEAKLTGSITSHSHSGLMPGAHASNHITGGNDIIPNAVAGGNAGLMSGADKTKLDGVADGANNYTHPANHTASVITQDANNRFVTDTEKTAWNSKALITVSASQPASPVTGDFWYQVTS